MGSNGLGWVHGGPEQLQLVEAQPSSRETRDARLVELWRRGYTLEQIGRELGMSKGGVCNALKRLTRETQNSSEEW
jgi:DNA-binding CsgD family transcriptional regulator